MAKINLRPWRQEERDRKQKEYIAVLVAVGIAAFMLWQLVAWAYSNSISGQQSRNQYLQIQSSSMDAKIKEIQELRKKRTQLLDRMKLIQDLQGNRPVIVRVFDEMTRLMPEEAYFETVKVNGTRFELKGKASSNEQISQLMRNLNNSPWFTAPNLIGVRANKGGYNEFDMTVVQTTPSSDEVK